MIKINKLRLRNLDNQNNIGRKIFCLSAFEIHDIFSLNDDAFIKSNIK